jgi:hypothetical protein
MAPQALHALGLGGPGRGLGSICPFADFVLHSGLSAGHRRAAGWLHGAEVESGRCGRGAGRQGEALEAGAHPLRLDAHCQGAAAAGGLHHLQAHLGGGGGGGEGGGARVSPGSKSCAAHHRCVAAGRRHGASQHHRHTLRHQHRARVWRGPKPTKSTSAYSLRAAPRPRSLCCLPWRCRSSACSRPCPRRSPLTYSSTWQGWGELAQLKQLRASQTGKQNVLACIRTLNGRHSEGALPGSAGAWPPAAACVPAASPAACCASPLAATCNSSWPEPLSL